ncbi:MAG: hypothetical protein JO115_21930 [Pseudonocardiales bacterium]|nr:hypothetical protein [Pseudonocardiales bacterium]
MAYRLGVDRSTVGRWESGESEPLPWLRPKLAELLGVTRERLDELLLAVDTETDPSATSELPSSDDDEIAESSEGRPEGSQSRLDEGMSPSPSLTQVSPAGDVAALFAAHLALFTAIAQSLSTGKGYNQLLTNLRRLVGRMNRRDLVQLFGLTTTAPFASSWLDGLDPDKQERVVAAIVQPERVDAQVITHIESVLFDSFLSNDRLGPRAALHTALAQQQTLEAMLAHCPDELRPRLLSVFGNSLRVAGWVYFNAGDLSATRRYYKQARAVAQDAQDEELAALILANLSHVAESSGKPAMAVDYAVVAQMWAARAHNANLSAFASDIGACAFAAMGDYNAAMRHLDSTQTYLPGCSEKSPSTPFYAYSEALHVARRGQCLLALGRTVDAVQVIGKSLTLFAGRVAERPDSPNKINIAVGKLDLSAAHVQAGDIEEGTAVLADVGDFVSQNRADRLVKRVRSVRAALQPWQDAPVVKRLDDQLYGFGLRS